MSDARVPTGLRIHKMRGLAERALRRFAAIHAPSVPTADVTAFCEALGTVSLTEALDALERWQDEIES